MFRALVTVALAAGIAAGVAWYYDLWPGPGDPEIHSKGDDNGDVVQPAVDVGDPLYRPAKEAPQQPAAVKVGPDPIAFADGHFIIVNKADVPSQKDGLLLFIGEEVEQGDPAQPALNWTAPVYVGDRQILKSYRLLEKGDFVRPGQMVAVIDPALALAERDAALEKRTAALADHKAAEATYEEAKARLERIERIRAQGVGNIISTEEYSAAILYRDRYRQEAVSKREAVLVADIEIKKALTALQQHEVRNRTKFTGIIKTTYKQRGEAVKAQEPVLQLYDIENLRAEGLAPIKYIDRLRKGARVTLEPTVEDPPWHKFAGHRREVNSVAFAVQGNDLLVVSGSEDHEACVWSVTRPTSPPRVLSHPDAVRVVACSPRGSARHWCVTGCADGSIRLWDLDTKDPRPGREIKDKGHRGAVTALAFSPDGKWFASGGEDAMIYLWQTEGGDEPVYPFDAEHGVAEPHQGTITSLQFTPQGRLVSASRDNTLRVWSLHEHGALLVRRIDDRQGTVSALGVSPDGGRMLFDQGRELKVMSVPEGRPLATMQSSFGATPFETLALFSPDASPEDALILTAGAPEGRLQLWRAPSATGRAFEVRQYATDERSPVTCAAFAPQSDRSRQASYAASGSKDGNVYLWRVPSAPEVANHCVRGLQLSQVEHALDANTRQVRIGVDVHNPIDAQNPYGRFMPGRPVTIVIEP
jgi:WD40 repeat protein